MDHRTATKVLAHSIPGRTGCPCPCLTLPVSDRCPCPRLARGTCGAERIEQDSPVNPFHASLKYADDHAPFIGGFTASKADSPRVTQPLRCSRLPARLPFVAAWNCGVREARPACLTPFPRTA